jgi:hypothetical protein
MELSNIILSEVSQVPKAKSHMFSFICDPIQIQQYYEEQVTLTGGHIWQKEGKRRK